MPHILASGRRITVGALLLAFLASFTAPLPALAAPSAVDLEREFIALVNIERAKQGIGAVTERGDITTVARRWSGAMAQKGSISHNPDFSTQITGWSRVSENVGVGPSVESLHQALMNSEGHRRNLLDDRVMDIGVGVVLANGRVWVTQNFRRPQGSPTASPPSTTRFGDVSSRDTHAAAITTVATRGIEVGCTTARYCPTGTVTRAQFASMLVRALQVPPTSQRRFTDVSGPHAGDIEALAAAGITTGCTATTFCPDLRLNRAQMASFLARALELPPRPSPFPDTHVAHDGSIGALHGQGIILGCTATRFCSSQTVNRAQTASMLARTVG
jgi:hypothetical protein